MAEFELAIPYVLENEGGDSDDAADRGGRTRFGITEKEARAHGYDVRKLTLDQAKRIYLADYWRFDAIADQHVATKLLDMSVNLGMATAVKMAQKIAGVKVDGVFGPETAKALDFISESGTVSESSELLLGKLAFACVRRYVDIVSNDHSQIVFLRGWIDRALKLPS